MVEYDLVLDSVFHSLADPTRRDILRRVSLREHSITELAQRYKISFAAVAKHLTVLEKASLIIKKKRGKQQIVTLQPKTIEFASMYLKQYEKLWNDRFDRLEEVIIKENNHG